MRYPRTRHVTSGSIPVSVQIIFDRGDHADLFVRRVRHAPSAGRIAIARSDFEIALRCGFDAADIGAAVLGELFGGFACILGGISDHFRLDRVELGIGIAHA